MTLKEVHCCNCGTLFGLDPALYDLRKSDGQFFSCPNGHQQRFAASPSDRLRKMTEERNNWQKEAERLLEEVDRARGGNTSRSKWFSHLDDPMTGADDQRSVP